MDKDKVIMEITNKTIIKIVITDTEGDLTQNLQIIITTQINITMLMIAMKKVGTKANMIQEWIQKETKISNVKI